MRKPTVYVAVIAAIPLILAVSPAYAYLDPGTGSMMLQALIGAVVGGMVAGRIYWDKLRSFFTGLFGNGSPDDDATGENRG